MTVVGGVDLKLLRSRVRKLVFCDMSSKYLSLEVFGLEISQFFDKYESKIESNAAFEFSDLENRTIDILYMTIFYHFLRVVNLLD